MNLLELIKKDFREFFREKRTFAMLFLAPAIILFVLGFVFGNNLSSGGKSSNALLGYCNFDEGEFGGRIVSEMAKKVYVKDLYYVSDCSALDFVSRGLVSAAIIIPKDFSKGIQDGKGQILQVLLDNSKPQVANSIESELRSLLQKSNEDVGVKFVETVWANLNNGSQRLQDLKVQVNEAKEKSLELRERLSITQKSLDSINFSQVEAIVLDAEKAVYGGNSSIVEGRLKAVETLKRLAEFEVELNASLEQMLFLREKVSSAKALTTGPLLLCGNSTSNSFCAPIASLNASLSEVEANLNKRIEGMQKGLKDVKEMQALLQELLAKTSNAEASVAESILKINNTKEFIANLKEMRLQALDTIKNASYTVSQLISKSGDFSNVVEKSVSELQQLTSKDPKAAVTPMSLDVERPFKLQGDSNYPFLVPGMIANLLMFIALFLSSTSIVREKLQRTLQRTLAAQQSRLEFVVKKSISLSIVLFMPSLLLMAMAVFLYGSFNFDELLLIPLAVLYLETLVFTAVGVVIATQSDSETTAFLISLVVGLPLLFTSGVLFALEFMPAWIASISYYLPLGQVIAALQKSSFYHDISLAPIAIAAYACLFVMLAWILFEKEKDL